MGFLYDPTWYAIDSPRGLADQAKQALAAGERVTEVLLRRALERVDRTDLSVSEWVMRDRPRVATLECVFCRKVLEELRRPRANGFSTDWVPWEPGRDEHCEKCALGVLAGTVKPVAVSRTVVRSRRELAKLAVRFELDTYHGDVDYDVRVTVFGEGFRSRRVEVWFGDCRARILKRVSDRELLVVQPYGPVGPTPVRVVIDGKTTELPYWFDFAKQMY